MTLLEDRLAEAVEARKTAPDSWTFVRAYARESVLRRQLEEREFSAKQREKLAAKGHALPHGGYPITDAASLADAIQAIGRAKNPDATKAFIKKRAKALGLSSKIPDSWGLQEWCDEHAEEWLPTEAQLQESAKTAGYAVTPHPFGKPGGPGLWKHKGLQLPPYIQNVAHGIQKSGSTESGAIAKAIGIIKRWAAGGGKVRPEVKAAAAAALAQWEALKASHGGGKTKTKTK
jgi:hypothetical protein